MTTLDARSPQRPSPAPGWYPDPKYPADLRYWDGRQWTTAVAEPAPAPQPAPQRVDWAPFILAVLIPIGGIIWGIVMLAKNQLGMGFAMIGASVVSGIVGLMLLAAIHSY